MTTTTYIFKGLRIFLGLFMIAYALNMFLHFLPTGYGKMPEDAMAFLDAVAIYLPYLYIFEIIVGLLLVIGRWTSAILIMLVPLSVSFLIFTYANHDIGETWPALVVAALNVVLLLERWPKYKPLFD